MNATRATEQSQDSQSQYKSLDDRYGKIGISAVVAALRYQSAPRDAMDLVKKLEKDHKISKDDHDRFSGDIQKATDAGIAEIDHMLAGKEKEILTV